MAAPTLVGPVTVNLGTVQSERTELQTGVVLLPFTLEEGDQAELYGLSGGTTVLNLVGFVSGTPDVIALAMEAFIQAAQADPRPGDEFTYTSTVWSGGSADLTFVGNIMDINVDYDTTNATILRYVIKIGRGVLVS